MTLVYQAEFYPGGVCVCMCMCVCVSVCVHACMCAGAARGGHGQYLINEGCSLCLSGSEDNRNGFINTKGCFSACLSSAL